MNPNDLRRAEEFLHTKIPLTRAMGIRVVPDGESFAIEAPVALNYNHLHTAFGGSINAVATLAAYTFLWLRLGDAAHVVVRESTVRFLRPIRETIRARCESPTDEEVRAFECAVSERGKASMKLRVIVAEDGIVAAEFAGAFVATASARRRAS